MEIMIQIFNFLAPYFASLFGAFVWAFIIFSIAKNKADDAEMPFDYPKYKAKNWDNWAVNVLLGLILVHYMGDVIAIINERTGWQLAHYSIYNLGAGVFTEVVYVGIALLFGWKKKFIPEGH